jgi:hypothetical protein
VFYPVAYPVSYAVNFQVVCSDLSIERSNSRVC